MNCIDLFAGAGGLSEGFRRQGFNIIAYVEKDYDASLTLKIREIFYYLKECKNLAAYIQYIGGEITREELYLLIPNEIINKVINKPILNDTIESIFSNIDKKLNGDSVDIIIGGPPCQAYSVVGRSRDPNGMKNDPRNYLYKQYIKFIDKYRPKLFVFENVTGLLSAQNGKVFKNIKNEMTGIGYNIDYRVLNSLDFGVLQNRKRIVLIGWRNDIDFLYPEFKKQKISGNINNLFYDLPKLKSGESMAIGSYSNNAKKIISDMKIKHPKWDILTQHVARFNNDRDLEIYRYCVDVWNKKRKRVKYNELPPHLITHNNMTSFLDRFKVIDGLGVCHTIVAHISKDGHHYIHPDIEQNRSITVREAARIQTFPDDYYFETCRTNAFKQIGNAVPPLMAEKIAEMIKEALE